MSSPAHANKSSQSNRFTMLVFFAALLVSAFFFQNFSTKNDSPNAVGGQLFAHDCVQNTFANCSALISWISTSSPSLDLYAKTSGDFQKIASGYSGMINYAGISTTAFFELRDGNNVIAAKTVTARPQDAFTATVMIPANYAGLDGASARTAIETFLNANASSQTCIDGGGITFKVAGTIQVTKNICLRNASFTQTLAPPAHLLSGDYIKTANYRPTMDLGAADAIEICVPQDGAATCDCRQPSSASNPIALCDPKILSGEQAAFSAFINVRTLLIKPSTADHTVSLENIKINRGNYGYGSEAMAGIWIDSANPASLKNIEIYGQGMGKGLLLNNVANATLSGINIHDLAWTPYPGDRGLDFSEQKQFNYNHGSTYLYDATKNKFLRTRTRENIIAMQVMNSYRVEIANSAITDVGAEFPGMGIVSFQADGFDLLATTDLNIHDSTLRNTWEGTDFGFAGTDPAGALCNLENMTVANTFGAAFKFRGDGHTSCTVTHVKAPMAGYAGLVIGGSYAPTPGNYNRVYGYDIAISDVGYYSYTPRGESPMTIQPWTRPENPSNFRWVTIAGVQVSYTDEPAIDANLQKVKIVNNTTDHPRPMLDGFSCTDFAQTTRVCAADHPSYLYDTNDVGFSDGVDSTGARGESATLGFNSGRVLFAQPIIKQSLQNVTPAVGGLVVLRAVYSAFGARVQWYFNGVPIAGAVADQLAFQHSISTEGVYSYKVSNGIGYATSSAVVKAATIAPTVALSASAPTALVGTSITLNAQCSGYPLPQVQWLRNAKLIDATTPSLKVSEPAGHYIYTAKCVIKRDGKQFIAAGQADLKFGQAPVITTQLPPSLALLQVGKGISISSNFSGSPAPTITWFQHVAKNNNVVVDFGRSGRYFAPVAAGTYYYTLSNGFGKDATSTFTKYTP